MDGVCVYPSCHEAFFKGSSLVICHLFQYYSFFPWQIRKMWILEAGFWFPGLCPPIPLPFSFSFSPSPSSTPFFFFLLFLFSSSPPPSPFPSSDNSHFGRWLCNWHFKKKVKWGNSENHLSGTFLLFLNFWLIKRLRLWSKCFLRNFRAEGTSPACLCLILSYLADLVLIQSVGCSRFTSLLLCQVHYPRRVRLEIP